MFNIFQFLRKKKGEEKDVGEGLGKEVKGDKEKAEDYEKEVEKDIAIHTMPERFRLVAGEHDKAKRVGIFIIGGGVLLLVITTALLYVFLFRGGQPKGEPAATSTSPEVGAKEDNILRQPEKEATEFQEIGTTTFPAAEAGKATATTTSKSESNELVNLTPGADKEGDGLTDKEEALFGSSPDNIDSDSDGYNDLPEVLNLYNPGGKEKLEVSSVVKRYNNTTYKYSLLYPASWSLNKIGDDDSVIIQSADNHFIQVIVQPGQNKQQIEDWYKEQFNVAELLRPIFQTDSWRGIKSDNDLIIYLTDRENNYIYTITYNLGENTVLEYKNILEMLIKSFVIKS